MFKKAKAKNIRRRAAAVEGEDGIEDSADRSQLETRPAVDATVDDEDSGHAAADSSSVPGKDDNGNEVQPHPARVLAEARRRPASKRSVLGGSTKSGSRPVLSTAAPASEDAEDQLKLDDEKKATRTSKLVLKDVSAVQDFLEEDAHGVKREGQGGGGRVGSYSEEALRQLLLESSLDQHSKAARLVKRTGEGRTTTSAVGLEEIALGPGQKTGTAEANQEQFEISADDVLLARKKREMARQRLRMAEKSAVAEGEDDEANFISLDGQPSSIRPRKVHWKARHPDDSEEGEDEGEDDEEDWEGDEESPMNGANDVDDDNRLLFGEEAVREIERKQRRAMEEALNNTEDTSPNIPILPNDQEDFDNTAMNAEEPDEMVVEWEQQQIRKGGHYGREVQAALEEQRKARRGVLPDYEPVRPFGTHMKRLEQMLAQMEHDQKEDEGTLAVLMEEESSLQETLGRIRGEVEQCGKKYDFYEELRVWLEDYVQWMAAKIPALQQLEDDWLQVHYRKQRLRSQKRFQQMQDALDDCWKGTSTVRTAVHVVEHSVDDDREADEDSVDVEMTVLELRRLFDDTQIEFRDLATVLGRFRAWREQFKSDYVNAYVHLALPGVLEPFCRRDNLLEWCPLNDGHQVERRDYCELAAVPWHSTVSEVFHGVAEDERGEGEDDSHMDDDYAGNNELLEVMAKTMEKHILPSLKRQLLVERKQGADRDDSDERTLHPHKVRPADSTVDPFDPQQVDHMVRALEDVHLYFDNSESGGVHNGGHGDHSHGRTMVEGGFGAVLEACVQRFRHVVHELLESVDVPKDSPFLPQKAHTDGGLAEEAEDDRHVKWRTFVEWTMQPAVTLLTHIFQFERRMRPLLAMFEPRRNTHGTVSPDESWFHHTVGTKRLWERFVQPLWPHCEGESVAKGETDGELVAKMRADLDQWVPSDWRRGVDE